jgi:hypothetical protein
MWEKKGWSKDDLEASARRKMDNRLFKRITVAGDRGED